jgi:hypothetical protein
MFSAGAAAAKASHASAQMILALAVNFMRKTPADGSDDEF